MAGPIYKLFKSHVNYVLMWILRILGPIKFCNGPIIISNGPLKFGSLRVFVWDISHWPILRAHHHFGLGLTLGSSYSKHRYFSFGLTCSIPVVVMHFQSIRSDESAATVFSKKGINLGSAGLLL